MGSTIHSDLLSLCRAFCMEAAADSFFWTSLSQKHFLLSFYLFLLSLFHSLSLLLITKRKKKKEFSEFILFYLFSLKLIHTAALIRLCCALKSKLSFDALCVTSILWYSKNSPLLFCFFLYAWFWFSLLLYNSASSFSWVLNLDSVLRF